MVSTRHNQYSPPAAARPSGPPAAPPAKKRSLRKAMWDEEKEKLVGQEKPAKVIKNKQPTKPTRAALEARIVELEAELERTKQEVVDLQAARPLPPSTTSTITPPALPPSANPQPSTGFFARLGGLFSPAAAPAPSPAAPSPAAPAPSAVSPSPAIAAAPADPTTPLLSPEALAPEGIDTPSRSPMEPVRVIRRGRKQTPTTRIVAAVAASVPASERVGARTWARLTCDKLPQNQLGNVEKQLQSGMKLDIDARIPSRYPWKQGGGIGALDDFFGSDSDSESESTTAPAWYVLNEIAMQPPQKKQRRQGATDSGNVEVTPLNEQALPSGNVEVAPLSEQAPASNTAKSTPRPANVLSPMFVVPADHASNGNVFKEAPIVCDSDTQTVERIGPQSQEEQPIYWQEGGVLKQAVSHYLLSDAPGAPNIRPVFSTPTDYDNKDLVNELKHGTVVRVGGDFPPLDGPQCEMSDAPEPSPAWTQPPPPPPTPSHATLPSQLSSDQASDDPVAKQRALLMKHTPARPSRLQNVMVPSPSVNSDSSILSNNSRPPVFVFKAHPETRPIDLGDDRLQAIFDEIVDAPGFKEACQAEWAKLPPPEIRFPAHDEFDDINPIL